MTINAKHIKKDFYRKTKGTNLFTAVQSADITLREGELMVIKGRSGGGKSTLMNMLSGILHPTEGEVYYDDTDIYSLSDEELSLFRNKHIGYIPQGKSAISSLNVAENIIMPGMLYGDPDPKDADELMERFDIAPLKNAMPDELSGGELRRMSIARALFMNPQVLFADEPTGDLDDENTQVVFEALRKVADGGTSVFMVTHEEGAEAYADKVFRMDAGVLNEQK